MAPLRTDFAYVAVASIPPVIFDVRHVLVLLVIQIRAGGPQTYLGRELATVTPNLWDILKMESLLCSMGERYIQYRSSTRKLVG